MKIYFAGSIRAGRQDVELYRVLIAILRRYGDVLTEHVGDDDLETDGERDMSDADIHDRDMKWLLESDAVVAEVTTPSLGVGYEIGRSVEASKPVLCLHRLPDDRRLSAMIAGSPAIRCVSYSGPDDAEVAIGRFLLGIAGKLPGR